MKVVIIGNGISGVTAARYIRKLSDHKILMVSGETEYFFSRTALMYVYMGHMKFEHTQPYENWFWEKNRIELLRDWITDIDTENKQVVRSNGERINYDKLIIASGSKPNKFGWPGQDLDGVQGLYSYQDLQTLEQNTSQKEIERAVVVGGGLIGIELAEMLHSRDIPVSMLVREESYWNNVLPEGESEIVNKVIRLHNIDLRLNTELKEIAGDSSGRVQEVVTSKNERISCQLVGLTAGVSPNIDWLRNTPVKTDRGVLINNFFETNVTDVYAIGDCAQFSEPPPGRQAIEQVWYTGKMHGMTLGVNLCESSAKEYQPGPWFNSAKFLDIEYQTYGKVSPVPEENEDSVYWENRISNKCFHLFFDKHSKKFLGINIMGIRCRHELFDKWLREKRDIEYVLTHLPAANFDPEFYKNMEKHVIKVYNEKYNSDIKARDSGLKGFIKLIKNKNE